MDDDFFPKSGMMGVELEGNAVGSKDGNAPEET